MIHSPSDPGWVDQASLLRNDERPVRLRARRCSTKVQFHEAEYVNVRTWQVCTSTTREHCRIFRNRSCISTRFPKKKSWKMDTPTLRVFSTLEDHVYCALKLYLAYDVHSYVPAGQSTALPVHFVLTLLEGIITLCSQLVPLYSLHLARLFSSSDPSSLRLQPYGG
jgi:hypothetical protein